ncbi:uncharacterized protein BT62DRAFT_931022 [Guyanagaster necrorhizus]|uniref:Uncharacterized protein n=1 Tax=Guyanagaster necrorhizus TaxID=856835 RepID=A0A9P7VUZ2_9AGAR|nr:uncharacterized protein BT62DRAFT_931022 [Guyanagaster necrorhizus MCA 3950]KAG7447190.1 hypothetical protein BT62DRAFT_931022 [Guyanagaster necrorhizus MCA 3950]
MSTILRQAASAARIVSRARGFSSTVASRKDIIQDLYLKELRGYKPAPVAKDAHVGVVKAYSTPTAPQPPTLPTDIASELAAYDASEPTLAEVVVDVASESADTTSGADAYLTFLEADLPKPEAHHH